MRGVSFKPVTLLIFIARPDIPNVYTALVTTLFLSAFSAQSAVKI